MDSMFSKLQEKLHQAKISNVNYQLGKAKETLVTGSANYFRSFRPDPQQQHQQSSSSNVGSLIRSESTRFGELLGISSPGSGGPPCKVPKSTSLPSLNRYKYKSTEPEITEDPANAPAPDVLARFIRVVEEADDVKELRNARNRRNHPRGKIQSREDIRRRLANWDKHSSSSSSVPGNHKEGNLQICFINEVVSEEDEDQDQEQELEDEEASDPKDLERSRLDAIKREAERRLRACQTPGHRLSAQRKTPTSQSQSLLEILSSHGITPSSGSSGSDPRSLNIASLQIIVNHYHSRIESLNGALVQGLLEKDELQIEQEGQLCDIEDLLSSRTQPQKIT